MEKSESGFHVYSGRKQQHALRSKCLSVIPTSCINLTSAKGRNSINPREHVFLSYLHAMRLGSSVQNGARRGHLTQHGQSTVAWPDSSFYYFNPESPAACHTHTGTALSSSVLHSSNPSHLTQPSLCLKYESPSNRAKKLNSRCSKKREKHCTWERPSLLQCHLWPYPASLFLSLLHFSFSLVAKKKFCLVTSWPFSWTSQPLLIFWIICK